MQGWGQIMKMMIMRMIMAVVRGDEHHLHKCQVSSQPQQSEGSKGSRPLVQPAPVVEDVTRDGHAARSNGHRWLEEEENCLVSVQRHLLLY